MLLTSLAVLEPDEPSALGIDKILKRLWIHADTPITAPEYMKYYSYIYKICIRWPGYPTFNESSSHVYDILVNFAASIVDFVQDELAEMPDDIHLLETCATAKQASKQRWERTNNVFRYLNGEYIGRLLDEGETDIPSVADLFARHWEAGVQPCLRKRMDRIAWRVRSGCHKEWEVNGAEWRMIKKFYGALNLHVTLTELGFREMFLCMRPIEFSMAQTQKLNRSVQSLQGVIKSEAARIDRVDTISPSVTNFGTQIGKTLVPAAIQHWSLVVHNAEGSTVWELEADNEVITVRQTENCQVTPHDGQLVGYTSLTNNEISANAEAVVAHIGKDYNFVNRNCQLLFALLHESIRMPLTINDLFTGLVDLPSSLVVATTRRRCRELADTYFTNFTQPPSAVVSHLPFRLGTLYLSVLAAVTVAMVAYTYMVVGVWLSVILSSYAMLWGVYAKGYYGVYFRMVIKFSEQDRYRFLYQVVYETVDDKYVREFIARRRVPSRTPQQQHGARITFVNEEE